MASADGLSICEIGIIRLEDVHALQPHRRGQISWDCSRRQRRTHALRSSCGLERLEDDICDSLRRFGITRADSNVLGWTQ